MVKLHPLVGRVLVALACAGAAIICSSFGGSEWALVPVAGLAVGLAGTWGYGVATGKVVSEEAALAFLPLFSIAALSIGFGTFGPRSFRWTITAVVFFALRWGTMRLMPSVEADIRRVRWPFSKGGS